MIPPYRISLLWSRPHDWPATGNFQSISLPLVKVRDSCSSDSMFMVIPEAGMSGWVIESPPSPLPSGLSHGERITVVKVGLADDRRTAQIVVKDQNGRQWVVTRHQLDVGHAMYLDGEYCLETHPKAVSYLRHLLLELDARIRAEREELHGSATWWEGDREQTRWYLSRNGHDPDETTPVGPAPTLTRFPSGRPVHVS